MKLLRVEARHSVWSTFLFTTTRTAHTERTEDLTSHFQSVCLLQRSSPLVCFQIFLCKDVLRYHICIHTNVQADFKLKCISKVYPLPLPLGNKYLSKFNGHIKHLPFTFYTSSSELKFPYQFSALNFEFMYTVCCLNTFRDYSEDQKPWHVLGGEKKIKFIKLGIKQIRPYYNKETFGFHA